MLILGLFSIIQALFLPGFIVLYFLELHQSLFRCLVLSAALSLVINFVFVFLLTLIHSYNSLTVFLLFGIEILLLFILKNRHKEKYQYFRSDEYEINKSLNKNSLHNLSFLHYMIMVLMLLTLVYYIRNIYLGTIIPFLGRDAFASYHQWAMNWYSGSFPQHALVYPQLLSANWSLTYIFISNQYVQIFANCISSSLPLLILLALFDLGLKKKQLAYFISLPMIGYLIYLTNGADRNFFTADIPITFFSLATIYLLVLSNQTSKINDLIKLIILGAVISLGAAFTKKSGVYLALFYPMLAWLIVLRQNLQRKKILKWLIYFHLLILMAILIFYTLKLSALYRDSLAYSFKNALFHINKLAPSFYQRFKQALTIRYPEHFGILFGYFILPVSLVFGLIANKKYRNIFLLFALPFFILWIFFFSYDCRNLSLILPLVAIISGYGINYIIQLSQRTMMRFFPITLKKAHLIISLFILLIYLFTMNIQINSQTIVTQQIRKQMEFVGLNVSNVVYKTLNQDHFKRTVMTNNFNLPLLPSLEHNISIVDFSNSNTLKQQLIDNKPILIIIYKLLLTQKRLALQGKNISFINSITDIKNYKTDEFIKNKILPIIPRRYYILSDTSDAIIIQED